MGDLSKKPGAEQNTRIHLKQLTDNYIASALDGTHKEDPLVVLGDGINKYDPRTYLKLDSSSLQDSRK